MSLENVTALGSFHVKQPIKTRKFERYVRRNGNAVKITRTGNTPIARMTIV